MPRTRGVTQADIAKAVGVSQAVVSDVLSGAMRITVSPETRSRVLGTASELGYVAKRKPVQAPPSEVLLVESPPPAAINEPWLDAAYRALMGDIVVSCQRQLAGADYGLKLTSASGDEALTQRLSRADFAGVLWHAGDADRGLLEWVAARHPLVLLNRTPRGIANFDCVSVDQERNVLVAADHLWQRGHRRIAFFGNTPGSGMHARRRAAYRQFAQEQGVRVYDEFLALPDRPEVPAADKAAAMLRLIAELGDEAPTALITADVFALPLLQQAEAAGLAVPRQLSVIGIDDTAACPYARPALSSLAQPFAAMARTGVDLLLRRIADPASPGQVVQVGPQLIARASVAAAP